MQLDGNWQNELGSKLTLTTIKTSQLHGGSKMHELTGAFVDGSGDGTNSSESFDVVGCAIEDSGGNLLLAFRIAFPPSNEFPNRSSISNWSGRLIREDNAEKLYTVWTLTRLSDIDEAKDGSAIRRLTKGWDHSLNNAALFVRSSS